MQAITKGLMKVNQEKKACKKDGHVSKRFRKVKFNNKIESFSLKIYIHFM